LCDPHVDGWHGPVDEDAPPSLLVPLDPPPPSFAPLLAPLELPPAPLLLPLLEPLLAFPPVLFEPTPDAPASVVDEPSPLSFPEDPHADSAVATAIEESAMERVGFMRGTSQPYADAARHP
jgi:hypothetical protein